MAGQLPSITGKQLIRLFRVDGWIEGRRTRHGISFTKQAPGGHTLVTIIPDKREPIPAGPLAAILGPKQSRVGRDGLTELIARHGLR